MRAASLETIAFADSYDIHLINSDALESLLRGRRKEVVEIAPVLSTLVAPVRPKYTAVMLKRIVNRGTDAGNGFKGYSRYPNCRGSRNLLQKIKNFQRVF
ncbi:MAG: hypothetical protein ACJAWL_000171 [Motiliproteus sp.]